VHLLIVLAVLWWWCPRCTRHLSSAAGSTLRAFIALLLIWVWVFSTPAIANLALIQLEGTPGEPAAPLAADARFVVLGSGIRASASEDGRAQLSLAGWRRVQAAVGHWRSSGGQLIFVGGLSDPAAPQATSLAATMAALARQWGVPPDAIVAAGHSSQNTRQDLLAARDALGAFNEHGNKPVYIVTSAAHMPRSLGVAQALGLAASPLPTDWRQLDDPGWRAWFPNNGGPALWQESVYELLGTLVYQSRGWLSSAKLND